MSVSTQIWNNTTISFASEVLTISKYEVPKGYVNATQMCKANGKEFYHWNENKRSKAFIDVLSTSLGLSSNLLIITITEDLNEERGTWVHPRIAINMGAWISPEFDVWIATQIETLMTTGQVQLEPPKPRSAIELVQQQLEALTTVVQVSVEHERRLTSIEEENIRLRQLLRQQQETIDEVKDMSEVHDLEINANTCELERFINGHGRWHTIIGYAAIKNVTDISAMQAAKLGRKASAMCKANNIKPEKINDPRFGYVNSYPDWVLSELM